MLWGFVAHQLYLFQQVMQEKLKQAHHLAEMYREQCVALESKLAQIREESDVSRELFKVPPVDGHVKGLVALYPKLILEISSCAGPLRENGQASAAHDEAIRGVGEEEGHGGRGLQFRPEDPQTEIQRCRKTTLQGIKKTSAFGK